MWVDQLEDRNVMVHYESAGMAGGVEATERRAKWDRDSARERELRATQRSAKERSDELA